MNKIMAFTAITLITFASNNVAAERIQYSINDATTVSNQNNNKISITFSGKTMRNPDTLTAQDPLETESGSDNNSGANGGQSNTSNHGTGGIGN